MRGCSARSDRDWVMERGCNAGDGHLKGGNRVRTEVRFCGDGSCCSGLKRDPAALPTTEHFDATSLYSGRIGTPPSLTDWYALPSPQGQCSSERRAPCTALYPGAGGDEGTIQPERVLAPEMLVFSTQSTPRRCQYCVQRRRPDPTVALLLFYCGSLASCSSGVFFFCCCCFCCCFLVLRRAASVLSILGACWCAARSTRRSAAACRPSTCESPTNPS